MTLAKRFIEDFNELPDDKQREVIDFVEFLKLRTESNIEGMMDSIITDNKAALEELGR